MGILSIALALLPILIQELQQFKVISPTIGNLITGIETAATPLINDAATASPVSATAILTAISGAVKVLQSQTTLSPTTLLIVQTVDAAIASGLAASDIKTVDPTALTPETPVA